MKAEEWCAGMYATVTPGPSLSDLDIAPGQAYKIFRDLVDWARETVVQFNDEAGWLQWRIVPESEEE